VEIGGGDSRQGKHQRLLDAQQRRRNVASCVLMVLIICTVSVSSFCLLKRMCDLKTENARLRAEHQRYQYLKEVIRAQVPEDRFIHNVPRSVSIIETEEIQEADEGRSWWSVNLSILWSPDSITKCDIIRLSHMLAHEIYGNAKAKI